MIKVSRKPGIVADAAWEVLTTEGQGLNGQTLIDEACCGRAASPTSRPTP